MSFSLFIWPSSRNNSSSFYSHSSPIIRHQLDNPPYNAPFVLVLLTYPTNTLVLETQRKSGKCDYWCCLFAFPWLMVEQALYHQLLWYSACFFVFCLIQRRSIKKSWGPVTELLNILTNYLYFCPKFAYITLPSDVIIAKIQEIKNLNTWAPLSYSV